MKDKSMFSQEKIINAGILTGLSIVGMLGGSFLLESMLGHLFATIVGNFAVFFVYVAFIMKK